MISPADIRKKALRQYPAFLTAVLTKANFFPLHIKGNKGKANAPLKELYPKLRRLLENAKDQKGFGYTVQLKTVNTRHAGEISMPDEIYFEHVEDYLKFIEKETEFLAFRTAIQQTRKQVPQLLPYLSRQPLLVIKNLIIWTDTLKILHYFQQHPQPNEYARALLIDAPSTFIEDHQKLLAELLNNCLPANYINSKELKFEYRFGLKAKESLVRIRFLDAHSVKLPHDIALPIAQWNQQVLNVKKVFLITDELNFLRFPKLEKSIALLASSDVLNDLFRLDFLHQSQLYFWGDLSINAFQQLSDLRKHFPNLISFLMSQKELNTYINFIEWNKKTAEIENLTLHPEERVCLNALQTKEGHQKLLQKHIRQEYLRTAVSELVD
ncbi:MAG: DUF3322 domain-containing protein [Bacteroidota bacterium]